MHIPLLDQTDRTQLIIEVLELANTGRESED